MYCPAAKVPAKIFTCSWESAGFFFFFFSFSLRSVNVIRGIKLAKLEGKKHFLEFLLIRVVKRRQKNLFFFQKKKTPKNKTQREVSCPVPCAGNWLPLVSAASKTSDCCAVIVKEVGPTSAKELRLSRVCKSEGKAFIPRACRFIHC